MRQGLIIQKAALAKQGLQLIGLLTRRTQTVLIGALHSEALWSSPRSVSATDSDKTLRLNWGKKRCGT